MIVNWKKKNAGLLVPSCLTKNKELIKNASGKSKVIIQLGVNEINDGDWEIIKDSLKNYIESGDLEVIGEIVVKTKTIKKDGKTDKVEVKEFKTKGINELEPLEAEKLIEECVEIETLKKWKKIVKDESVRVVLNNQIEKVENYLKTGKKED